MSANTDHPGRSLRPAIAGAVPLFVSIALLLVGSGLAGTLLGIRAGYEGFGPGAIGIVLAGYYVGYVGGSLFAPRAIRAVGHIRVFGGLAGLASAALLGHLLVANPISWFILRVIVGWCLSAQYVVCETWLNGVSTNRTRGGLMAVYMVIVSGSFLGGQGLYALVGARGFEPLVISSVLVSLAVVPVSLVAFAAPPAAEPAPISLAEIARIAPLAITGTAVSGFVGAAMLSAGVVYAAEAHFNQGATGAFVGASLAGGVALQYPLGRLSDHLDRRLVLAVSAAGAMVLALVTSQVATDRRLVLIALTTFAGGVAFPIYSLAVTHLNDYIDDDLKVAAGAKMVLVNGYGAIAGPIVGSFAIGHFGPGSLYVVVGAAYAVAAFHSTWRMFVRAAPIEADRATFAPVAVGVGPTTVVSGDAELADLLPHGEGDARFGGLVVRYAERGAGPPIVLVGDVNGARGDVWSELIGPLSADGFHVIAPVLGAGHPSGEPIVDAVRSVMRHLGVRSATLVGYASGCATVSHLALAHPEFVDALVLIDGVASSDGSSLDESSVVPVLTVAGEGFLTAPSDVADDIAEFVRPIVAGIAAQWETGRFDAIEVDDP